MTTELGSILRPAGPEHPWRGRRFSGGWNAAEPLVFQPVVPEFVAEIATDTAVDAASYRHPRHRIAYRNGNRVRDRDFSGGTRQQGGRVVHLRD
ncbi:hypothetical protein [Streptomyces misionensis]|uniref:hypothetical protein n=1 Tax=Streptomyces misionensis TaxID=67331 RepID=UPI0036FADACF